MNKHTAGQWFVAYKPEIDVDEIIQTGAHSVSMTGGYTGKDVYDREDGVFAIIDGEPETIAQPYNESDARLIAAAPDMLEALITDYLVFKNYENIHNAKGNVEKAFSNKAQADRIRGIIESATGENIEEAIK